MTCSPLIISPELQHTTDCHQTPIVQYNTRIKKLHPRTQPACLSVFLPSFRPVCLLPCVPAWSLAYRLSCMPGSIFPDMPHFLPVSYCTCNLTFQKCHFKNKLTSGAYPACLSSSVPACLSVCLPLFLPICLPLSSCISVFWSARQQHTGHIRI